MISDTQARALASKILAHAISGNVNATMPDLSGLDPVEDLLVVAVALRSLSGRAVELEVDLERGVARFGLDFSDTLDEGDDDNDDDDPYTIDIEAVLSVPSNTSPDLDAALERWVSLEDGDEEAER